MTLLILLWVANFPQLAVAAREPLPADWTEVSIPGVDRAWVNSRLPGDMITLTEIKTEKPMQMPRSESEIAAGIVAIRELTLNEFDFTNLRLANIARWTAHGWDLFRLSGSFIRPDGVRVSFFEVQAIRHKSHRQVSYLTKRTLTVTQEREAEQVPVKVLNSLYFSTRSPASDSSILEADTCTDCGLPVQNVVGPQGAEVAEIRSALMKEAAASEVNSKKCQQSSFLFNPETRSILQELNLDYKGSDPLTLGARGALTCFYGVGAGAYKSLKDLLLLVPKLIGLSWRGMKSLGNSIANADLAELTQKISPQKLADSAKRVIQVTNKSVKDAFSKASESAYRAYEAGGVTGAMSAIAHAAYDSSPHRVVGRYILGLAEKVSSAIAKEWEGFKCLPPEVISEKICQIFSYIATDILTGKLVLSALTNPAKLASAIAKARSRLERMPIAGAWLTRHLKEIPKERCDKVPAGGWMVDSIAKLQNQDIDVHVSGDAVIAQGVSPKSKSLTCFEVVGALAKDIRGRVEATKARVAAVKDEARPAAAELGVFSPMSQARARTNADFVREVNAKGEIKLNDKTSREVSRALARSSRQTEDYGSLLKTYSEMKTRLRKLPEGSPDRAALAAVEEKSKESIGLANQLLAKTAGHGGESASRLNIRQIESLVDEAARSGDTKSLAVLNRVLYEVNKSAKGKSLDDAFAAWEKEVLSKRRHLSANELKSARNCLSTVAK